MVESTEEKGASVVIPALNEREHVASLIRGLAAQRYRPLQIVVVDGGSRDGTVDTVLELKEAFEQNGLEVALLREEDFGPLRSPSNARNVGVRYSSGFYIIFLDADFVVDSQDLVEKIVEGLSRHDTVGIRVEPLSDTWLEYHTAMDRYVKKLGGVVHTFCGYRRSVFNRLQFDPSLGFGEDQDFNIRAGLNPVYLDAAVKRHFIHDFREWRAQMKWYGRTYLRFARKHGLATYVRLLLWLHPLILLFASALFALGNLHGLALLSAAGFLGSLIYSFLSSKSRGRGRIVYVSLSKTYAVFWLLLGVIVSTVRNASPSRK